MKKFKGVKIIPVAPAIVNTLKGQLNEVTLKPETLLNFIIPKTGKS